MPPQQTQATHQRPGLDYMPSVAELLLLLAHRVLNPKDEIVSGEECPDPIELAKIALALKLHRSKPAIRFRAMVEDWTIERIVREVY